LDLQGPQIAKDTRVQDGSYVSSKILGYTFLIVFALAAGLALAFYEPFLVLVIVMLIVMAALLIYYPFLGVYAYLIFEWASLTRMFETLQKIQMGKLLMLSVLFAWIVNRRFVKRSNIIFDKNVGLLIAWVAVSFAAYAFAINQGTALEGATNQAKWALTAFLIANLLNSYWKWFGAMAVFLTLNLKMSQYQIQQWLSGVASTQYREGFISEGLGSGSNAFFGNAGDFGVAMCVAVPFAFYLFLAARNRVLKVIGLFLTGFFVVSIVMSGARGNSLALFSMAFVIWMRSSRKALGVVLLVLFAVGYLALAPDVTLNRFANAVEYEDDKTSSDRLEKWAAGVGMFATHPVFGVGINCFGFHYIQNHYVDTKRPQATAPHNIFVQAFTESGAVGIVVLCWLIYNIFRQNRDVRAMYSEGEPSNHWITNYSRAIDISLVGYMVSGSFLTVLYYPHFYFLIALSLSLYHITKDRIVSGEDIVVPVTRPA